MEEKRAITQIEKKDSKGRQIKNGEKRENKRVGVEGRRNEERGCREVERKSRKCD